MQVMTSFSDAEPEVFDCPGHYSKAVSHATTRSKVESILLSRWRVIAIYGGLRPIYGGFMPV